MKIVVWLRAPNFDSIHLSHGRWERHQSNLIQIKFQSPWNQRYFQSCSKNFRNLNIPFRTVFMRSLWIEKRKNTFRFACFFALTNSFQDDPWGVLRKKFTPQWMFVQYNETSIKDALFLNVKNYSFALAYFAFSLFIFVSMSKYLKLI